MLRAIAVTPVNLLLQLLLLPVYLWLMAGAELAGAFESVEVGSAVLVVLLPLLLAAVSERWIEAKRERELIRARLAWLPVPLLALVVFLIAGAQAGVVLHTLDVLPLVVPLCVAFLVAVALIAKALARLFRPPTDQGRTLASSLGTRNSFVALPFALALPVGWETAAVVIVVQPLVELSGMVFYLWWIPRRLIGCRAAPSAKHCARSTLVSGNTSRLPFSAPLPIIESDSHSYLRNEPVPRPAVNTSEHAYPATVENLYLDHHNWLQAWLRRRLGNAADAADLAHDAFIRLLSSPRQFASPPEARGYLRTMANGMCIDLWRRREVEQAWLDTLASQPEAVEASPEHRALIVETLMEIGDMLGRLSHKAASAFIMAQIEGMPYRDIAARLEVSERMVKKYIAQAMLQCALIEAGLAG